MQMINGQIPVEVETEYGVMFDDGFVVVVNDEQDARETRAMTGGDIVARDVYITPWGKVFP